MTRVKIINHKNLPHQAQSLLRKIKDRTGVVVDRYTHPQHGYEVWQVQFEPSCWGISAPAACCEVL